MVNVTFEKSLEKLKEAKRLEVCIECPFFYKDVGRWGKQEVFLFAGV